MGEVHPISYNRDTGSGLKALLQPRHRIGPEGPPTTANGIGPEDPPTAAGLGGGGYDALEAFDECPQEYFVETQLAGTGRLFQ